MAAMEIDVSRLQTPPLFEKRRARKLPRTPEIERKQYLDLWDLSVWEEDDSSKSERPSAIDDIMRRSSVISKKEENDENEPPATDKERAADIEIAIKWIRQELSAMRDQDRKLLRQFTAIRNGIQHLKTMREIADADSEGDEHHNESYKSSSISSNANPPRAASPAASSISRVKPVTPTMTGIKNSRVSQLSVPDSPKASSAPSSPVQLRMSRNRRTRPQSMAQGGSFVWQGVSTVQLRNATFLGAQKVPLVKKKMNVSVSELNLRKNKRNSWC